MKVGDRVEIIEFDPLLGPKAQGRVLKMDDREWKPMSYIKLDKGSKGWKNLHGWFYNSNLRVLT